MTKNETNRLFLRPFTTADVAAVFAYRSLPAVARYQYWEPYTMEQAETFVKQCAGRDIGTGSEWVGLAVVLKENGELIGDCALKIDGCVAETGCNISPGYQHKGLAKEVLSLLFARCFNDMGVDEVYAITDAENTASVKLMQALGMVKQAGFEERVMCKGEWCTEHKYAIKCTDWLHSLSF